MLDIDFLGNKHGIRLAQPALCLFQFLFEDGGRDRALVNVEQGHVAICDLMEKDDEFNEVCVRLLPEGFLAPAEEVVQERRNVVGQRVSVEVIIQGVVAVLGAKTYLNIVLGPVMTLQNTSYFVAEVPFHFQNQTPNLFFYVARTVGKNLLGERVHATARLAGTDCADDGGAREESPLRDREPMRSFGRPRLTLVVDFAHNNEKFLTFPWVGIEWQFPCTNFLVHGEAKNIKAGQHNRISDVRSCEQEEVIGVEKPFVHEGRSESHELQKDIFCGEWQLEIERHSRRRCQEAGDEVLGA